MSSNGQVSTDSKTVIDTFAIGNDGISQLYLLQRIALGLNYASTVNDAPPILKFGFTNVLNVLSPKSVSIWKSDFAQSWTVLATDGEDFSLPAPFQSWNEINQNAILMRQPLVLTVDGDHQSNYLHWAVPVLLPGGSCYVMHLLSTRNDLPKDMTEAFLSAFAFLVIKCDGNGNGSNSNHNNSQTNHTQTSLSERQLEILRLAGQNLTYAQIGRRMGFSESTIKQESMKIFRILGVHNKSEALKILSY